MTAPPRSSVRVAVPASTANLGSGFDALGMALALHDEVHVEVVDGVPGSAAVTVEGQGAGAVPADEHHLVVRVIAKALSELGYAVPALRLHCRNAIPHSRGLGSSAAAIIAGVAAAHALGGLDPRDGENADRALQLAAEWEGHADNVAASLHGGLVIAWNDAGRFHAAALRPHPDIAPIVLVPQEESATHTTRGLLPERVPHADAAFAAGRAALAVHALTRDPDLLMAATDDRLHQDYREPAWPGTVALVRALRAAGVPAAVSGAGPTVLALPRGGELPSGIPLNGFTELRLPVDTTGVRTTVDHA
ncbi:homoserine kinase [Saccharopolyspora rosea]|uniref:Homoserine kinase n=1 Tax=Saccharopolyspora rosea TaxID=524884 RepID=A0ABW3G1J2_9PSEU|nr:homoserine kinase [Saccharopolyspora rosea]